MGLKPLVRPLLIHPHQARLPRHVGGEDSGETPDRGHVRAVLKVRLTQSTSKPAGALVSRLSALRSWPDHHNRWLRQMAGRRSESGTRGIIRKGRSTMRSPWMVSAIGAICFAVSASAQQSNQSTQHEIERLVATYAEKFN